MLEHQQSCTSDELDKKNTLLVFAVWLNVSAYGEEERSLTAVSTGTVPQSRIVPEARSSGRLKSETSGTSGGVKA
jgi:hypothetical protein